jgi:hypothetical protein
MTTLDRWQCQAFHNTAEKRTETYKFRLHLKHTLLNRGATNAKAQPCKKTLGAMKSDFK